MHVLIHGFFTLRAPLSHIGEAISTTSYLVQEPLLQSDGRLEEVFVYNGNAWRGQLRDLAASYMLDHLGTARVPLEAFHLLFSGGRIGGDQVVDINAAREMRRAVPMIALFGGGVGNQILPGKLRVLNSYPVCAEAAVVLPDALQEAAAARSYRGMTFEKSFSRKDDAKDDRLRGHLFESAGLLEGPEKAKAGPADQMRMTCELLAAGAQLYTEIECLDVTEIELGVLVSALHAFSRSPHIGGQANRGHGKVRLDYRILDMDSAEERDFVRVHDGPAKLAAAAQTAKDAYDQHLRAQYDALLADRGGEIRKLLAAV